MSDRRRVQRQEADTSWPQLSRAAYYGVIGDIVKAIEPETEADPAALLVQMFVMFGSVIGRSAHFRHEADVHYLNLFAGIVGQTAKGRKGVSRGRAQQVFNPIDPDWSAACNVSGLSSGEGLIWAIRDPIEKQQAIKEGGRVVDYQTVVEDPGVADKRLLATETEMASTLKVMSREGNTLSPILRQAWDGQDLRALTKTSAARATKPHVAIIAHITRDELRRHLEATETANGFGNRFLWVCVKRSKELPDGGQPVDLSRYVQRLKCAVEHARCVGEMHRDVDAGTLWRRIYGPLSAGRPGLLGAMTARAEAQVMRLACLYAIGDMSYVVARPHLRAALSVWNYCYRSVAYIFGDRLGDPTADEILSALRTEYPASLTRSEITRELFARNKPASEIARALDLLLQCRLAEREEDHTGAGRPTERWCAAQDNDINDIHDISIEADAEPYGNVVNVVNVVAAERGDRRCADELPLDTSTDVEHI